MRATSPRWRSLVAWFGGLGWELTAHRLPGPTTLPVVLAAAVRSDNSGAAVGRAPEGDLAAFLTPQHASTVAELLDAGDEHRDDSPDDGAVSPVDAAREAGLTVWLADLAPPGSPLSCVQAFSPDTMPFPATNRGRRLDHPALRARLAELGRDLGSVPALPHPLG